MKTIAKWIGVSVIAGALVTAHAKAQCRGRCHGGCWSGAGCAGAGCWGTSSQSGRMYDPKTVETVAGEVASVEQFTPASGMSSGVHLQLKTGQENLSIHLGPSWYLENKGVQIKAKDKIEVTGSRITFDGKPAIVAAEVKKGDQVLKLRDENGFPQWAGWRRR